MLTSLAAGLKDEGVALVLARVKGPMRRRLEDAGVTAPTGTTLVFGTVRAAVASLEDADGHRGAARRAPRAEA